MQKLHVSSTGFSKLCCEILLLLNIADMDCLMWKPVE